jgi:3'(2'), 5'-bisphosphate nucleotidase
VEFKADDSPLTEADRAAHEIIVSRLASTPYPVLSEESKAVPFEVRKEWDRYWLVDPIDGTKEFIRKNGEFTVNIALIEHGRPILGVVLVPVSSVFYLGDDVGAFKAERGIHYGSLDELLQSIDSECEDLERISVSGTVSGSLKVVASKSHCNEETLSFIEQAERVYGVSERVSSGSSIKLCMVAEGAADVYPPAASTTACAAAVSHSHVGATRG